ncbi:MAG: tetratricopeptide repeat protein [Anaerolineae bacterium]|nr:tetratricopeptide repeat protein [Anaerolineae bacterium]
MDLTDHQRQTAEYHLKDGQARLKQRDYAGALRAFDQAVLFAPRFAEPWLLRGALRVNHLNDLNGGIEDCTRALRLLPGHPGAHANRGIARLKQQRYALAAEDFGAALLRQPLDGSLHRLKAYCHYELEEYERAIVHYSASLKFWHEPALCHDMRGVCHYALHAFEAAAADFDAALQHDPGRASAYSHRGILHTHRGAYAAAIADHTTALSRQPLPGYYGNRGLAHLLAGDSAAATADCEAALALDGRFASAYGLRGQIRFVAGDLAGALDDFRQMQVIRPAADADALVGQSLTLAALGQLSEALTLWRRLLQHKPRYHDPAWLEDDLLLAAPLRDQVARVLAALAAGG